jgi:hypothetical protein
LDPAVETTGQYACCHLPDGPTVGDVSVAEPATLAELIADCEQLSESVPQAPPLPSAQREAPPWRVSEECLAQVAGMEDYGS